MPSLNLKDQLAALPELGLKVVDPYTLVESEIERRMIGILSSLSGLDARPVFLSAIEWQSVGRALNSHPTLFAKERILVVLQAPVLTYKADFMVIVKRSIVSNYGRHFATFFIECDGKEFHSGVEKFSADIDRDRAIQRLTGAHIMHFSGAEILSCPLLLSSVIEIYVEAMLASGDIDAVQKLRRAVEAETAFYQIRGKYNGRDGEQIVAELTAVQNTMRETLRQFDFDDEYHANG